MIPVALLSGFAPASAGARATERGRRPRESRAGPAGSESGKKIVDRSDRGEQMQA
jgi:hypothetical protein